mmetsp:Transcript_96290/g.257524  ORF Transcript_96290/g.257524 Transcript_96290/m.257524 type:complete len:194 (+) Transcript_96290:49-630(+)
MPATAVPEAPLSPQRDRRIPLEELLAPHHLTEFHEIFNLIDRDGSGSIDAAELATLVESVGMRMTEDDVEAIMKDADVDGSGTIEFEEFVRATMADVNKDFTTEEIGHAFSLFSRHAPLGHIRVEDMMEAVTTFLHGQVDTQELQVLLQAFEQNIYTLPGTQTRVFNYQSYIDLMGQKDVTTLPKRRLSPRRR